MKDFLQVDAPIDEMNLRPGLYVYHGRESSDGSLVFPEQGDSCAEDTVEPVVTVFDLRFYAPKFQERLDARVADWVEADLKSFLNLSSDWKDRIVYFGRNNSQTGFFLVSRGKLTQYSSIRQGPCQSVLESIRKMLKDANKHILRLGNKCSSDDDKAVSTVAADGLIYYLSVLDSDSSLLGYNQFEYYQR